ncbi:MAG: HIT family protein [Candidatus Bathyarchaeota archaeon]
MNECVFCRIAEGEEKAEKIYETDSVVSFLDINPKAPGHSLVIPKKHVKLLSDLDERLVVDVFKVTKDVVGILKKALNPDAFNIGINDGRTAGQEIPHFHVNIFPRFKGDGGRCIRYIVNNPPIEEISETAKKIRQYL